MFIDETSTPCEGCEDQFCGCTPTENLIYNSDTEGDLGSTATPYRGPALLIDEDLGEPFCHFPRNPETFWTLNRPYQTEYAILDLGAELNLRELTLYAGEGRGALHVMPGSPGRFGDPIVSVSRQNYHHPEWLNFRDLNVRTRYLYLRMEGEHPRFGALRVCGNPPKHETEDASIQLIGTSCHGLAFEQEAREATHVQVVYRPDDGFTGQGHPAAQSGARSLLVPVAGGRARYELRPLRPATPYHLAYRYLYANGERGAWTYPNRAFRTLRCEAAAPFADWGVHVDQCRPNGLRWSIPARADLRGHFEVFASVEVVRSPEGADTEAEQIELTAATDYVWTPERPARYLYLRFVGYGGAAKTTDWFVWDRETDACAETEGRAERYFGTAVPAGVDYADGITLHPNPTDGLLYLTTDTRRFTEYVIVDALGQEVQRGPTDAAVRTMRLDVPTLRDGVYFLQLRGKGAYWRTVRFVVARL